MCQRFWDGLVGKGGGRGKDAHISPDQVYSWDSKEEDDVAGPSVGALERLGDVSRGKPEPLL